MAHPTFTEDYTL